ncbi:MAG: hypothetical protein Q8R24_11135 [Legionellaceae bacterium]|nr:hypothetical protein [Legionellaceae bacterium]
MPQNESSILILKPTSSFISFIASQLPDIELPDIATLQADSTAYAIRKCEDDESVLSEVERIFPLMLKHESSRVVGDELSQHITGTFLDFLCCFKFELHSQFVWMESCIDDGHQLLCVKPRSVVLKWMSTPHEDHIEFTSLLEKIELSHLTEHATVLVKNSDQISDVAPFLKQNYRPILNAEMVRLSDNAKQWPVMNSFKMFSRYFAVELHTHLVHLH